MKKECSFFTTGGPPILTAGNDSFILLSGNTLQTVATLAATNTDSVGSRHGYRAQNHESVWSFRETHGLNSIFITQTFGAYV